MITIPANKSSLPLPFLSSPPFSFLSFFLSSLPLSLSLFPLFLDRVRGLSRPWGHGRVSPPRFSHGEFRTPWVSCWLSSRAGLRFPFSVSLPLLALPRSRATSHCLLLDTHPPNPSSHPRLPSPPFRSRSLTASLSLPLDSPLSVSLLFPSFFPLHSPPLSPSLFLSLYLSFSLVQPCALGASQGSFAHHRECGGVLPVALSHPESEFPRRPPQYPRYIYTPVHFVSSRFVGVPVPPPSFFSLHGTAIAWPRVSSCSTG